jgi:FkbM family methyltransferase
MSVAHKAKTALNILKTKGLAGVSQATYAKFGRSHHPDETRIVFDLLKDSVTIGLMIDVGAHHGSSLATFAEQGWQVIAFEPDTNNRLILTNTFGAKKNIIIDPHACSDHIQSEATFYTSAESTGVSGLSAFLASHQASEKVPVTTLATALEAHHLLAQPVDFLKIDTEGFDLMVLKGFPWQTAAHPKVILCEFENAKTDPLGYNIYDLADFLVDLHYNLLISEWYPVKTYGSCHRWRRFSSYPCQLVDPKGWGNIFAVKELSQFEQLMGNCHSIRNRL